jgi:hypothetical protein
MLERLLFLVLVCFLALAGSEKVRFDGHQVVRVNIKTPTQHKILAAFQPDVWSHDGVLPNEGLVDVRLPKAHVEGLSSLGFHLQVLIDDVQALIDSQEAERSAKKNARTAADDFFDDYHDFEEIVYETKKLVEQYDDIATFVPSIGKSIQGRDIVGVHIHAGPFAKSKRSASQANTATPKLWFNGGQHAREWIGPMTVMFILTQFLQGYGTDENVTKILNHAEVIIVPVVNPDGLDYSFTDNRLWRKNRRQVTSTIFGVDLNRNWDDHWGGGGSSGSPSSDIYRGTAPFSEPETRAVSDYIKTLDNIVAAIDFHSYSQLILRPYGWGSTPPPNEAEGKAVGALMQTAVRNTHGMFYTNEGAWELYIAAGGASDWFYSEGRIPLSYTIELRDTGRYGFLLPANQIIPTGQEALAAVFALSNAALSL